MPTYMSLIRFTQKGMESIKEAPARLDAAKKAIKATGGELKQFYLLLGQYDAVVIGEHPNDEIATKHALAISSQGTVRTETFRVFTEEEFRKMIASLP